MKGPTLGYTDNFPKRQMWEEIAKEYNGEFKIQFDSSHAYEIHHISIPYRKWTIEITVSDTQPLKFHASFSSLEDFELLMSWEDFIEKILKGFSKPEIELGWKDFDKRYLIKSNRSDHVKRIFSKDIQKTMLKHNVYSISFQTNLKTRKSELFSVIQRRAGNNEMIADLIDMFQKLMDNMEKSGVIK